VPFASRQDCHNEEWIEILRDSTGIFITGGSQLRLSRTIGGTPVAHELRDLYRNGVHIAGTSAGASYMSEHMIAFGDAGASPVTHMVAMAPGIGLTSDFTIDQHFRERDRLGRLLTVLAYNPFIIGMGLDEDTAAFIGPHGILEVVGSGSCTLVDGSELEYASVGHQPGDPVSLLGVKLHILLPGSRFEIKNRQPTPALEGVDREVQEL
jgi:cyanophycinase